MKRRQHAEADPCEHRHGRDEHHRQSVHTDVLEEWNAGAIEMRDQARAAERQRQSQRRAAAGERQAFDEQLTDQTPASGAERHPQRHFLVPRRRPRQQQVRDVRRDQQHQEPDRGRQHRKRAVKPAADAVLQRTEVRTERVSAPTGFDVGCRPADAIDSRCRFDGGGRQIDPRFQSADHGQRVPPSIRFRTQRKGEEQIGGASRRKRAAEVERRRQHADDRHGCAIEGDRPADHVGLRAQAALPERVAQDRCSWCAPQAFLGGEVSSEPGTYAQQRKEALRHGYTGDALGFAGAGQPDVADAVERRKPCEAGQRLALLPQIDDMSDLNGLPRQVLRRSVRDPDQASRVVERQRPKPQRVDDAEDGRAGADANPDDQDRERRQRGVAPQGSHGISQIAHQRLDEGQDALHRLAVCLIRHCLDAGPLDLVAVRQKVNPSWRTMGVRKGSV